MILLRRRRERTPELDLKELEEEKKMEPLELLRYGFIALCLAHMPRLVIFIEL